MKRDKVLQLGERGIDILFKLLMAMILIVTIFLDKKINNPFPNTVKYANVLYYFIAAVVFICVVWFLTRNEKCFDKRVFYGSVFIISILAFIIQCVVVFHIPLSEYYGRDFKCVMEAAVSITEGGTFQEHTYFDAAKNNVNVVLVCALFYKLFGSWKIVECICALLVNLSVVFCALTIYQCTANEKVSLFFQIVGEVLVALSWRAFLPYTDNCGMIFVALVFWLYTGKLKSKIKIPLLMLVSALGTFVKFTVLIAFLAILIHTVINYVDKYGMKIHWKRILLIVFCFWIAFGGMLVMQKQLRTAYSYETSDKVRGWQFFFMVGQNDEFLGTVNKADRTFLNKYSDLPNAQRMQVCLEEAVSRIRERKIIPNIKFYLKKIAVAYNDGYFNNVQSSVDTALAEKNIFSDYYITNGKYYQVGAALKQVLWNLVLVSLAFGCVSWSKDRTALLFQIAILGITFYLMLVEGRSKYLYMFLPIYVSYAGISFCKLSEGLSEIKAVVVRRKA